MMRSPLDYLFRSLSHLILSNITAVIGNAPILPILHRHSPLTVQDIVSDCILRDRIHGQSKTDVRVM